MAIEKLRIYFRGIFFMNKFGMRITKKNYNSPFMLFLKNKNLF